MESQKQWCTFINFMDDEFLRALVHKSHFKKIKEILFYKTIRPLSLSEQIEHWTRKLCRVTQTLQVKCNAALGLHVSYRLYLLVFCSKIHVYTGIQP